MSGGHTFSRGRPCWVQGTVPTRPTARGLAVRHVTTQGQAFSPLLNFILFRRRLWGRVAKGQGGQEV